MPSSHAVEVYDPSFLSGYALALALSHSSKTTTPEKIGSSSSPFTLDPSSSLSSLDPSKVPAWRREH